MGTLSWLRPANQQQRQLAVRFYSKWYCATSGVEVLTRRIRLAASRYIVHESATIKVCLYEVTIMVYLRKLLFFLKYFEINYVLNSLYIMFDEKPFNENLLLMENYINTKTKSDNTIIFACAINYTCKLTLHLQVCFGHAINISQT